MSNYPEFSDFADEAKPLEGDKVAISRILDTEIIITGFDIKRSKYSDKGNGQYLTLQFKHQEDSDHRVLFTGSGVLMDQLKRYAERIPFIATIQKINRYFTLT